VSQLVTLVKSGRRRTAADRPASELHGCGGGSARSSVHDPLQAQLVRSRVQEGGEGSRAGRDVFIRSAADKIKEAREYCRIIRSVRGARLTPCTRRNTRF
jgi:hypothetical protein